MKVVVIELSPAARVTKLSLLSFFIALKMEKAVLVEQLRKTLTYMGVHFRQLDAQFDFLKKFCYNIYTS